MKIQEKILLVELLLHDVRCNWGEKVKERVEYAIKLCDEIDKESDIQGFRTLKEECNIFLKIFGVNDSRMEFPNGNVEEYCSVDGRYFRDDYPYGYENMSTIHGLSYNLNDKSDEFKEVVKEYITCPNMLFEDEKE